MHVRHIAEQMAARWKWALLLVALLVLPCLFLRQGSGQAAGTADSVGGPKVIVLNYHKIENGANSLFIPPSEFERQMAFLAQNGYHTITPHELYMAFTDDGPLPTNPVLITFDDGYADNYTNAYPILKKYGLKATIFVITSLLDKSYPGYLTWGQAAEMEASGVIAIESHTVTHGSLTDLTDEQIRSELTGSKHEIEQRLGKEVEFLAYPTGAYNLHIARLAKEAGYKGAFTIRNGNMDRATNFYAIERVPIFQTADTFSSFLERLKFVPLFERLGWHKN